MDSPEATTPVSQFTPAHFATLCSQGLFDREWYKSEYSYIAESGLEPEEHFFRYGVYEGRSPCAEVDMLRLTSLTSLPCHEALILLVEGRLAEWWPERAEATTPSKEEAVWLFNAMAGVPGYVSPHASRFLNDMHQAGGAAALRPPEAITGLNLRHLARVAVTAHLHFPESVEQAIPVLAGALRMHFDVLVTTTSATVADEVLQRLNRVESDGLLDVRVTPNRGRNFGPFLVEFGSLLARYDVIGHFHGKRSTHMPPDVRDNWLSTLFAQFDATGGMLRSVARILLDPGLGVIGTFDSTAMPVWALSWLSNTAGLEDLFPRDKRTGFIEYPVGGFFWARPAALEPLWRTRWEYSNFPEEDGQLDGTPQHVIERLIGVLPSEAGFRVEIDTPQGRTLQSEALHQYRSQISESRLINLLSTATSVSFDFFDTLVCRSSLDSERAKHLVAQTVSASTGIGFEDFIRIRNGIESDLRVGGPPLSDVTLVETYRALVAKYDLPFEAEFLAQLEEDRELEGLVARPGMANIVAHCLERDLRTFVVSDTYYSRDFIVRAMNATGFAGFPVAHVLVSSETGRRKDRDEVFPLAGCSAQGHVHFGDNLRSDIQLPHGRGCRTVLVAHPFDFAWLLTGQYSPGDLTWRSIATDCVDPWALASHPLSIGRARIES